MPCVIELLFDGHCPLKRNKEIPPPSIKETIPGTSKVTAAATAALVVDETMRQSTVLSILFVQRFDLQNMKQKKPSRCHAG